MKVVIAGTRTFDDYETLKAHCAFILKGRVIDAILCGECRGADLMCKRFAQENGINVESYPADWKRFVRAAGVRRNRQMAENADCLIAFWDGKSRGTASMIKLMDGKEVHIVKV